MVLLKRKCFSSSYYMYQFQSRVRFLWTPFLFYSADFATLLSAGELTEKSSIKCTPTEQDIDACLLRVCFHNNYKGKGLSFQTYC